MVGRCFFGRAVADFRVDVRRGEARIRAKHQRARFIGVAAGHDSGETRLWVRGVAVDLAEHLEGRFVGLELHAVPVALRGDVDAEFAQSTDGTWVEGRRFGAATVGADVVEAIGVGGGLAPDLAHVTSPAVVRANENQRSFLRRRLLCDPRRQRIQLRQALRRHLRRQFIRRRPQVAERRIQIWVRGHRIGGHQQEGKKKVNHGQR